MDWLSKELVSMIGLLLGFAGVLVRQHYSDKNNRDSVNKKIEDNGLSILKKLQESDENQTARLDKMESVNNSVKTMMELGVFEEDFVRKFKHSNKQMIQNSKKSSDDLKSFLKGGVSELSIVFSIIIKSQFRISDEEIQSEFDDAEIALSSKFKAKNPEYSKFKDAVDSEVLDFIKFYQDVKTLANGDRMDKFEKLCERTVSSIIKQISR